MAFGHVPRKRGSRHGLSNAVEDTSGAHSWVSFEVSAGNIQATGTCMHCLEVLHLPLCKKKSNVMVDGPDAFRHMPLERSAEHGISPINSARNVGAYLWWWHLHRRSRRAQVHRKASANTRNLTATSSNAAVLGFSVVPTGSRSTPRVRLSNYIEDTKVHWQC